MLDLPAFPSYRIDERLRELRRLGLSPPVVRLAMFDPSGPHFVIRCEDVGPPVPEWREQQPPGPPVSYLWSFRDTVTGGWIKEERANLFGYRPGPLKRRVEFIKFKPNSPSHGHQVIAHSEQGLLANLFWEMLGDEYDSWEIFSGGTGEPDFSRDQFEEIVLRGLTEAAECVGFRYLKEVESFRRTNAHRGDYGELLAAYTRSIP